MIEKRKEKAKMQEVRIRVEYIYICRYPRRRLHMSQVPVWIKQAWEAGKRWAYTVRHRALVLLLSVLMAGVTYIHLAAYVSLVRGYRAYGGECLAAVAVGILCYLFLRGGDKNGA